MKRISFREKENVELKKVELSTSGNAQVTFSANQFLLPIGAARAVDINVIDMSTLVFGDNVVTITARDTTEAAAKNVSTFTLRKSFCVAGARTTNLTITDIELKNTGDDDENWKLLDEVTIEVEVENNADDDEDVIVELGLFDNAGRNVVGKLDFSNDDEEEIKVNINDDDSETVVFTFRVSPDLEDGNYKLAVKAYGDDAGESNVCTDTSSNFDKTVFQTIKIENEDDEGKFIAFDKIQFSPTEATCGDLVTLTLDAVNIGNEDQDRVKVTLKSTDLKLDVSQELRSGLDVGDDEQLSFTLTVPQGLADKTYTVDLSAEYDYRSGIYREMLDAPHRVPLKVFGCTLQLSPSTNVVSISAALTSDALPGKPMVVKVTLKNTASQEVTTLVNAKGYESWAKLSDVSQRIVTLAPSESKDVSMTFDVNKDAAGEQSFTLEVTTNDKIQTQQVAVALQGKESSSFFSTLGENKLAWIIGIINLVLIIVIIIVAVKISQR